MDGTMLATTESNDQVKTVPSGVERSPNQSGSTLESWLESHVDGIAFVLILAGFTVRTFIATRTYLNPNEALH